MAILTYKQLVEEKNYEADAVDDDYYRASMNPRGKSARYIKSYILPELQAKALYFKSKLSDRVKQKETKAEAVRKIRKKLQTDLFVEKKRLYGKTETKLNIRSTQMYNDMTKIKTLASSNYLDGYLQFRHVNNFLSKLTVMSKTVFDTMFVIYCHDYIYNNLLVEFTKRNINTIWKHNNFLIENGYVERYKTTGNKYAYKSTKKAHLLMGEMLKSIREDSVKVCREFDKMRGKVGGQSWAKYDGKRIYQIKDIYEETDIHKFDKGTK